MISPVGHILFQITYKNLSFKTFSTGNLSHCTQHTFQDTYESKLMLQILSPVSLLSAPEDLNNESKESLP